MGRRVASRLLWALPPAACVVAALFAWQVAGSLAGPGGAAHREAEVSDDMDGLDAARRRVEDAAESARASSAKTFLDDLGASFDSGGAADAEALPADDSAAGSGSSEVDRSEEDADVNSPDGAPEGKAGEEEGSTGSGITGAADDAAGGEASADVSVAWSDDEGLVSQATGILEAYRDHTDARVATSGYLDLKGNVWGAIVRDIRWVDVVLVRADAEDASSTAQVVRLRPGAMGEGY